MSAVVDLAAWREQRSRPGPEPSHGDQDPVLVRRLEVAVERLHLAVENRLSRGRLEATAETELLAIMGELSLGTLDGAADRAERLAERLAPRTARPARA